MAGVYTVKQVNSYIKNMFKQDFLLNSVSVKGEISNCKYHTSVHIYFTLKDADAALSVIMFASQAAKLAFKLKDGMSVVVSGRVDVFDAAGKYQLYANTVQQEGIGELYQKFEQLKQYYEDMGYFAKEENYEGDNPPVGIILSKDKDELLVEYATYGMSSQLFVSKYQLYLPDKEELRKIISRQLETDEI